MERKITALYAKGTTTRDIQETIADIYGVEVTAATISPITDKVWPLVEEWQNRPLAAVYPIVFLDALHVKLRREGEIENVAVYTVLAVGGHGWPRFLRRHRPIARPALMQQVVQPVAVVHPVVVARG